MSANGSPPGFVVKIAEPKKNIKTILEKSLINFLHGQKEKKAAPAASVYPY
jgi:hypothetical protein